MNREEAVVILKNIFDNIPSLDTRAICLIRSEKTGIMKDSYEIYITATIDIEERKQLINLLNKYGVSLKEFEEHLVIFRPQRFSARNGILYFRDKDEKASKIIDELLYDCPLCKKRFSNPTALREHRLTTHRSVLNIIKTSI